MAISLMEVDDLGMKDTKPAKIWPASVDRTSLAPLEGVFIKNPDTGDIIVGYEDLDELEDLELVIQLDDGNNSEYRGTFNSDGLFVLS